MNELTGEIQDYWTNRSESYSKVNKDELACAQKSRWLKAIEKRINNKSSNTCKVLDIGTGPGFFSIILAEAGYAVTAVDFTQAMLNEAKSNAGIFADKICFKTMDAQNLDFDDNTFDVIVTRNLTWNLQKPEQAYKEWMRVLKKDGILLNFDANWYCYIDNEEKRLQYEADRNRAAEYQVEDFYEGTDIESMEEIARKLPLSNITRPSWDKKILLKSGASDVQLDLNVWEEVWSEDEKINYTTTPMFLILAKK